MLLQLTQLQETSWVLGGVDVRVSMGVSENGDPII